MTPHLPLLQIVEKVVSRQPRFSDLAARDGPEALTFGIVVGMAVKDLNRVGAGYIERETFPLPPTKVTLQRFADALADQAEAEVEARG